MSEEPRKQNPPKRKSSRGKRRSASRAFGKGAYVESSSVRHQARVLAMQTLFEFDATDHELDEIIGRVQGDRAILPDSAIESADADESLFDEVPREVAVHAEMLVRGTISHMSEIDPILEKAAPAFPLAQIAAVDRNVLRLAIFELYHQLNVPVPVVINEAVEIAKRFGGDNSSRFVNGVLGTIGRQLPPERHKT